MKKPSKKLTLIVGIALAVVLALSCTLILVMCGSNDDEANDDNGTTVQGITYEKPIVIEFDYCPALLQLAYDESGRLVSERATSLSWTFDHTRYYEYDNSGKVSKILGRTFMEGEFEYEERTLHLGDDGVSYGNGGAYVEYHQNGAVKNLFSNDVFNLSFDENGKLVKVFDEHEQNYGLFFNYEGGSKMPKSYTAKREGKADMLVSFTYNADGYITEVTAPDDYYFAFVKYTYDEKHNVISEYAADKRYNEYCVSEASYDSNNNISESVVTYYEDENKTVASEKYVYGYTYNAKNLLTAVTFKMYDENNTLDGEMSIEMGYDANGRIVQHAEKEPGYKTWVDTYEYNEQGALIRIKSKTFDKDGNLLSEEISAEYEYDELGRTVKYIRYGYKDYAKAVSEYEYDVKWRKSVVDERYYDENGDMMRREVFEYTYDENGRYSYISTNYDKDGNITGTGSGYEE